MKQKSHTVYLSTLYVHHLKRKSLRTVLDLEMDTVTHCVTHAIAYLASY
jgi:hypothetical protein